MKDGSLTEGNFARDGFTVRPVFDPALVQSAEADIVALTDRVAHALYMPFEQSRPDVLLRNRLNDVAAQEASVAHLLATAICTDAHRGPRISALAQSTALFLAAQNLVDRPLVGSIARIRASIAALPSFDHGWHSDVAIDDGSECGSVVVTAWLPLSDDGGLEVAASRLDAPLPHGREPGAMGIAGEAIDGLPLTRAVCPVGSAVFLDRFTPHRTVAAIRSRFALVVWFKAL